MTTQAAAPTSLMQFDCGNVTEIPQTECETLVALYEASDGENWTDNTNWLVTNTPCSWYGITCDEGNVSNLELSLNNLTGLIPPEISNLSMLTELNLSMNWQLSGSIPPEIGSLTALTYLGLSWNKLSGSIPSEFGNLTELTELNLAGNQLSGSIPPEIGDLTALTSLYLGLNQLTDPIPSEIGNLTALTVLNLRTNLLSDPIPPEIGNLIALTKLDVAWNQLTGPIPLGIVNLTTLEWLDLSNNQLSGVIPMELGDLTSLMGLYLNNNQLSGELPVALTSLTQLDEFHFFSTDLCVPPTGAVPEWLDGISDVQGTGITCSIYIYLPLTLRNYIQYFEGPWEVEPNDTWQQANGPLISGRDYYGYPNDARDYFSIYTRQAGEITVNLTGHTGEGVQLQLWHGQPQSDGSNRVAFTSTSPYQLTHTGAAGWYYIYIYTPEGHNEHTRYTLRVTYPQ